MPPARTAAAAGGITTVVASPDTRPIMDEIALVEFLDRQAQASGVINVLPSASITKGMAGTEMTEIGLLDRGRCARCSQTGTEAFPTRKFCAARFPTRRTSMR